MVVVFFHSRSVRVRARRQRGWPMTKSIGTLLVVNLWMNGAVVSGYVLQTAQTWANAGDTEDGHCQGACSPQWFCYVPYSEGTDINAILRFTRDTVPNIESHISILQQPVPGIVPVPSAWQADAVTIAPPALSGR